MVSDSVSVTTIKYVLVLDLKKGIDVSLIATVANSEQEKTNKLLIITIQMTIWHHLKFHIRDSPINGNNNPHIT